MKIKVRDGLEIGDGCPTFIIAEVGSNWSSLQDCMTSISQAKLCGADAVKFQAFNHEALYGFPKDVGWTDGFVKPFDMPGTLPAEWLPKLKEKCDAVGIEFMCSAFSPELLDEVNKYVNIHKLASAEMNHKRMLEKLRGYGKPVIMSTGAAGLSDILASFEFLTYRQHSPGDPRGYGSVDGCFNKVILMYCVAAYPAQEINLDAIPFIRNSLHTLVGFSDHSTDVGVIPLEAWKAGASQLESELKHLKGIEQKAEEFETAYKSAEDELKQARERANEEYTELSLKNTELESECSHLRAKIKSGIDKAVAESSAIISLMKERDHLKLELEDAHNLRAQAENAYAIQSKELAACEKELESTRQWYGIRIEELKKLFKGTAHETALYNVLANGIPDPTSPPSFAQQMNLLRHKLAACQKELEETKKKPGNWLTESRLELDLASSRAEVERLSLELQKRCSK